MGAMAGMDMSKAGEGGCGAMDMTSSSVNLHYHGANVPPVCHQDEVIRTIINSGQTFRYEVHFPKNEPPGFLLVSPAHPRSLYGGGAGRGDGGHYCRWDREC